MYKIVVADDEKLARDVVIKYILSLHLNFEIVGGFSNGSDALDYIKNHDVDVVITDIKMPKMSGMELCKHICAVKPKCKIVILSGYGEFTYARQAIEYNVFNYLLKPLDLDELTDVLTRLNTILDEETVVAENEYQKLMIQQEAFLTELIFGIPQDAQTVLNEFSALQFPFAIDRSAGELIQVTVENYEEFISHKWMYEKEKITVAMANILKKETPEAFIYPLLRHNEKMVFAVIGGRFSAESIQKTAKELLSLDLHIEAMFAFDNILSACNRLSLIKNIDNELEMIASCAKTGDESAAKIMLKRLISVCLQTGEYSFNSFLDKAFKTFGCNRQIQSELTQLKTCNAADDKAQEELAEKIISEMDSDHQKNSEVLLEKILTFIDENYTKDISRDDVAEHVYLNAAYFSRYFSTKTGRSFSDYLLDLRMKKAMELLGENVKIYQVGERVGYRNNRNFLRTFKKYTGYTPSEYRLHVLKKEE